MVASLVDIFSPVKEIHGDRREGRKTSSSNYFVVLSPARRIISINFSFDVKVIPG